MLPRPARAGAEVDGKRRRKVAKIDPRAHSPARGAAEAQQRAAIAARGVQRCREARGVAALSLRAPLLEPPHLCGGDAGAGAVGHQEYACHQVPGGAPGHLVLTARSGRRRLLASLEISATRSPSPSRRTRYRPGPSSVRSRSGTPRSPGSGGRGRDPPGRPARSGRWDAADLPTSPRCWRSCSRRRRRTLRRV